MVTTVANMSVSEIDKQIRTYSVKILILNYENWLRAKIAGSKFYKIGTKPTVDKKSVEYKYQLELAKREIEAEFIAKEKAELDARYADIDIVSLDYWMWERKRDREEEEIIEKYYQNENIRPKSEIIDIDKFKNELQKYEQTKIENKREYLFIDIILPEYAFIDVILPEYAFIDEKPKFGYSFIEQNMKLAMNMDIRLLTKMMNFLNHKIVK